MRNEASAERFNSSQQRGERERQIASSFPHIFPGSRSLLRLSHALLLLCSEPYG